MFSCYKVRHVCLCKIIGILILFSTLLMVLRFSALHKESNTESSRLSGGNVGDDVAEYVHNGIHKNAPSARNNELLQNLSHPLFQLLEPEDDTTNKTMFFQLSETRMSQVPDKFSIQGSSICSVDEVDLLIFMMSVARDEDAAQRLKIRETWASSLYDHKWQQTTRTRIVFFFGDKALNVEQREALHKESKIYGDVGVGQFHDSYGNLSVKMVDGLTWAGRNCGQVRHLAKIDMDTYVNIPVLLELVENVSNQFTEYVLGYENKFREVWRTGKWAVSEKVYPFKRYPKFTYGHSYVISGPALHHMVKSFPYFSIMPNEDAFITGIMPKILYITRLKSSSFAYLLRTPPTTYCDLVWNGYATSIYRSSNLDEIWKSIITKTCLNISLTDMLPSNNLITA